VCRCWLLAGDHARAAAKASKNIVPLIQSLQQHAVLQAANILTTTTSASSSNASLQQQQSVQLQQLPEVQQLLLWQGCLDSFDALALAGPCWQEMFAYNLLAGALRAFGYSYMAVSDAVEAALFRDHRQMHHTWC
jgi:hypothetical protein